MNVSSRVLSRVLSAALAWGLFGAIALHAEDESASSAPGNGALDQAGGDDAAVTTQNNPGPMDFPGELTPDNVYIHCVAQIYTPGEGGAPLPYIAIEIPTEPNYGVPVWNIGTLPVGGVADSWYDGGPGKFRIRNAGNVPCYIHIIAVSHMEMIQEGAWMEGRVTNPGAKGWLEPTDRTPPMRPSDADGIADPSLDDMPWYALAVAVNMLDPVPRWNVLNQLLWEGMYFDDRGGFIEWSRTYGLVLGRAQAGEHMVFDLKFWAPQKLVMMRDQAIHTDPIGRLVRFEAAEFPRWPAETWVR